MPTFLLIRHAVNDYVKKGIMPGRLPGIHLNKDGVQQAEMLAEKLGKAPIKAIYSSPLERSLETAQPLAKTLDIEIQARPGLAETDCGEWQGQTVKSLRRLKAWKIVQNSPSLFRFPGGESFAECQARFIGEIEALRGEHEEKDLIVCVSHGDPIRLGIAYYLGMPLDQFQRLSVSPASINALYVGEASSRLLTMNIDLSFNLFKK